LQKKDLGIKTPLPGENVQWQILVATWRRKTRNDFAFPQLLWICYDGRQEDKLHSTTFCVDGKSTNDFVSCKNEKVRLFEITAASWTFLALENSV